MKFQILFFLTFTLSFLTACDSGENQTYQTSTKSMVSISKSIFGKIEESDVYLFTLKNQNGITIKITNYGGIITSLSIPDKDGKFADVVFGFDNLDQYLEPHPYFGAIVGRYGNRIANGKFKIDNKEYTLAKNNNGNHLHGGIKGFDKKIWDAKEIRHSNSVELELSYTSPDMEEGYPGNLDVKVNYTLTNNNELKIRYTAKTDKTTICNLTNHSYFNLAGEGSGDVMNHEVKILADRYTATNANLIPTGELPSVEDTPFDLRNYTVIGKGMDEASPQLQYAKGYDTNFVLNKKEGTSALIVSLREPNSGRVMDIFTSEPGVQLYCGNWLDGTKIGKSGKPYLSRGAVCLETQHFPDSPNHPEFPSTLLKPNETYNSLTVYKFSVMNKGTIE